MYLQVKNSRYTSMSREDKIAFILSSNLFYESADLENADEEKLNELIKQIIIFLEEAETGVGFEIRRKIMIYLN